jgi:hypothetical protein
MNDDISRHGPQTAPAGADSRLEAGGEPASLAGPDGYADRVTRLRSVLR